MQQTPLSQGNAALRNKDYEAAIRHYNRALAQNPELAAMLQSNIDLAHQRGGIPKPDAGAVPVATVDIVVPVYNALEDVKKCLESLQRCTDGLTVKVIVVNDGSDEATTQWLREYCGGKPVFKLIEHEKNAGYTKAVNTGLKATTADYAITQNSDTIVSPGWLTGLIRCMNSSPTIGIVGPLSNAASWQNVPNLRDEQGNFAVNDLPAGYTVEDMARAVQQASNRAYPRLPFVNGFCFMIKRAVMDNIGFMDEENFPVGYGEENDYCIRALDSGYELAIADDVYVFHAKSKSFGHNRRKELSSQGTENLKKKHTALKFHAYVEIAKKTSNLDKIRSRINQVLKTPEVEHKNGHKKTVHLSVATIDMHGSPINLSPEPVYGNKEYEVNPKPSGPCLLLPFNSKGVDQTKKRALNLTIGVHLHLHYQDMLEEFIYFLKNIEQRFSLYVSINNQTNIEVIRSKLTKDLPHATVCVEQMPNKGRDIGPFLAGFGTRMAKHEIICHIHSKRSLHNVNKSDWRRQLLVNLLGSKTIVRNILQSFLENERLGIVFPEYHHSLQGQISWGTNFEICKNLANDLNIEINKESLNLFPAGSMFWAKRESIQNLFDIKLDWNNFPDEDGQVDGTVAHAVERLFGEIATSNNFELIQSKAEKPHNLIFYHPHKWPFEFQKSTLEINHNIEEYRKSQNLGKPAYAVFTALTGGYDQPVVHENLSSHCDYLLFTDSPANDRGFWKILQIPYENEIPVRRSRYVKTNPQKYLQNYDIAIWIDANVIIKGDIEKYAALASSEPNTPIFGITHPHRNCIYEEATAVIASKKDTSDKVIRQIERYRKEGFPKKFGLIETNLLVINLKHSKTRELFEAWSNEIENGSHRDQLSLNYCLWKTKTDWKPIFTEKTTLRDSFDFAYLGHGRNSGYPAEFPIPSAKIVKP